MSISERLLDVINFLERHDELYINLISPNVFTIDLNEPDDIIHISHDKSREWYGNPLSLLEEFKRSRILLRMRVGVHDGFVSHEYETTNGAGVILFD
jgi:hypothetical protein